MSGFKNILSPIMFAIIIISFSLPFFNLTCQNQKITSVSGFDLMMGTTISPPELYNTASQQERLSPEPMAVIAFIIAVAALVLGFFRKAVLPVAALSLIGTVTLVLLSSKISGDIEGRIELQGITTEWASGMYMTFIIFITAVIYNLYLLYENKYSSVDIDDYTQNMKICNNCGVANERGNIYCSKCGSMLP